MGYKEESVSIPLRKFRKEYDDDPKKALEALFPSL